MSERIIIEFDQPGKVCTIGGVDHIVLITAVRQALKTDLVLRNHRDVPVGKIVDRGLVAGVIWVALEDVSPLADGASC